MSNEALAAELCAKAITKLVMSDAKTKIMHKAALSVLERYENTGEPFAVFLSSWAIDEVYRTMDELLGRPPRKVNARIGLERQVRILLQKDKLDTVAVYRKGDFERIAIPQEWPSLSLSDDEWRARVGQVVQWADLVVLFWGATTEGLTWEVEMCASGSIAQKTVVVTPAAPRDIFLSQLYKTFPRIVPRSEIPPMVALHPEFTSLIDRMKAIKLADPQVRSKFVDPEKRLRKFPLPPVSGRFN